MSAFDTARLRADFPILRTQMRGKPLVYLDTAASAQKPQVVIEAVSNFYRHENANIHRGLYELSEQASLRYEAAREKVRELLGAADAREIIFTRNTTEAINLVAWSWGRSNIGPGDEVLITALEHHANLVPWQQLCAERGARLRVAPISDDGELELDGCESLLGRQTKLIAAAHVSNAIGTRLPVKKLAGLAQARGIPLLLDGAQAAPRFPVNVRELGADFYAVSGHKLYGPTGIGALYARAELLESMPPWQTGGGMIEQVSFERSSFAPAPVRFEAGTPDIAGAVGLAAAVDYLRGVGLARIEQHEAALLAEAVLRLGEIPGLRIIAGGEQQTGVLSFVLDGVHPHDVGAVLDAEGVAIRAGHHCAQPLMKRLGVTATARVSFGLYNTSEDIERLAAALRRCIEIFR
ncbi:MAG: cysteine desulfurase [Deltaproteobacteria bacterium]|nr:cysteine desulfurase [Deltaproteobacteria bacterium]